MFPDPTSMESYHLHYEGKQRGPYTVAQIRHMFTHRLIPVESMYLREGMEQWHPVEELFAEPPSQWRKKAGIAGAALLFCALALLVSWEFIQPWLEGWWERSGAAESFRKFVYIWFFRTD